MRLLHFRKDVRLPVQLQRAMAAEAEATREARAKVDIFHIFESPFITLRTMVLFLIHFLCPVSPRRRFLGEPETIRIEKRPLPSLPSGIQSKNIHKMAQSERCKNGNQSALPCH